ncbi:MAG: hypothetical protein JWO05_1009 [Gemmatimonadetes bacterium]|nr:hypothetical protein [Gemmatimonadota bacterium]
MDLLDEFEPERELSSAGQQAYDDLCDLVYMGAANPVSAAERADGIIPEDELRKRISQIRLETANGRMI